MPAQRTPSKIRTHLLCKGCGADWEHLTGTTRAWCPHCGKEKDARERGDYAKRYNEAHPQRREKFLAWSKVRDNDNKRSRLSRKVLRKRALFKVGGSIDPRCVRCGCDDARLLEINHKNGNEGRRRPTPHRFYTDIATGIRGTDDLEILCKPCNHIHYLELKYGPLPMKVVWGPDVTK